MGLLDKILGRTKAKPSNLDALFGVTGAAVTLEASVGLRPAGQAAVSFKPASGTAFSDTLTEVDELVRFAAQQADMSVTTSDDDFGYRWYTLTDDDVEDLVTSTHLINRSLEERGFGPQLLCSVFAFNGEQGMCHLVYLFKRGTFYPFAPRNGQRRDNELELRVRGALGSDVPIEADMSRWFALWGLPLRIAEG
jgi:hypothetical protein